jgi:hypothetical protein
MSIEAMKQALEALEIYWSKAEHRRTREDERQAENAITSLRQAIAEAEKHEVSQEPVAVVDSTISGDIDWLCVVFPKQGTKLYTHPQPKREPLTDEQIAEISVECATVTPSDIYFARAIEAAHGIRGDDHV